MRDDGDGGVERLDEEPEPAERGEVVGTRVPRHLVALSRVSVAGVPDVADGDAVAVEAGLREPGDVGFPCRHASGYCTSEQRAFLPRRFGPTRCRGRCGGGGFAFAGHLCCTWTCTSEIHRSQDPELRKEPTSS